MLLLSSMMQVFTLIPESDGEVNPEISGDEKWLVQAPTLDTGNLEVGGYHLKTGDWWEGLLSAVPSSGDPDGDGIDSSTDTDPWNRNIGTESGSCLNGCHGGNNLLAYDSLDYTGSRTISVSQLGDMDKDGDLDLVMAHGNSLYVSINEDGEFDGDSTLTNSNRLARGNIDVVDIDLDGDLDIVTGGYKGAYVHEMDGDSLVSSNRIIDCEVDSCSETNFFQMDFGDVNNDGYPDILLGAESNSGDIIRLFVNAGDGSNSFTQEWAYTSALAGAVSSTFIDYDSDGDSDIAFSTQLSSSECEHNSACYPVLIFNVDSNRIDMVNDTHDLLLEPENFFLPISMESADLNHDGDDELVIADSGSDVHVYWNLNSSTGSPGLGLPEIGDNYSIALDLSPNDFYTAGHFNLVDMNGDGLLDLLLGTGSSGYEVGIALATDLETAGAQIEYEVVWATYTTSATSLLAGDLDGNGLNDVVLSTKDTTISFQRFSGVSAKETVERSFDAVSGSNYGTGSGLIVDIDADGDNDLLLSGQQEISVYKNSNGLSSVPDSTLDQYYGTHLASGDVNGDGYLDLVTTGYENELKFRWGHSSGFNTSEDIEIIPESNKRLGAVHIKDFNGDGYLDISMDSMGGSQGTLRAYIYTYDGNGGFDQYWKSEESNTSTGNIRNAVIADINGDGLVDYIRCAYKMTLVYQGTSTGSGDSTRYNFSSTSSVIPSSTSYNRDCEVADIDSDGFPDLILSNTGGMSVYMGPVSQSSTSTYSSVQAIENFDIADFNLDGTPDMLISTKGTNMVKVVSYNSGTLYTLWEGGYYRLTRGMLHGDLNEDGVPDLVALNMFLQPDLILGVKDLDIDGVSDTEDDFPTNPTQGSDYDSDGFGDYSLGYHPDACVYYWGDSTEDRRGCPDQDGDGWSDLNDDFWRDGNQWNDTDLDGYGDNFPAASSSGRPSHWPGEVCPDGGLPCSYDSYPLDWDDDGYEDSTLSPQGAATPYDDCPFSAGTSSEGDTYGCLDSDIDGWANVIDTYPTQNSQHNDTDGDGFGDNESGWLGDHCPDDYGESVIDYYGCLDNDFDGVSYLTDLDDNDPLEQSDTDNDTVGDNSDLCPYQWSNLTSGPDRGCPDSDGDLKADRNDAFPTDATQWFDADGDGYGDDPLGNQPDEFTSDPTQWADADGDGKGDNANGNNGDAFPQDSTQWNDKDGDGYGDQNDGNESDKCKDEAGNSKQRLIGDGSIIEWYGCADADFDLVPDIFDDCSNTAGTSFLDRIACPDSDNDAVSDMNDPYPYTFSSNASDGDWDNDSYTDMRPLFMMVGPDIFPDDSSQWQDSDGDGFGDNQSGNNPDMCLNTPAQASVDEMGCASSEIDDDGDGVMNDADLCANTEREEPVDSSGCLDGDEDGVANTQDAFPDDDLQWSDIDGDGYGDNQAGTEADACISISGTSRTDRLGCVDSDGDGYSDQGDQCPNLPGWSSAPYQGCPDRDSDGFADVIDLFPDDSNESTDSDGDGFGNNNDTCFSIDANVTVDCVNDRDNDGFNDSSDVFPDDASEWSDQDGDGYGDNSDVWPSQSEIWSDGDGDEWADQYGHLLTDDCPSIPGSSSKFMMGCSDIDGDGMPDLLDPDIDGDGITNDNEMDASTSLIEYDPFDANSTPPDMDGDSIPDLMDKDTDGDGFPNDMEKERGSDHEDTNKTPFNIYGDQDTGLFYVPGEGFKSQYDPGGMEISLSVVLDMVTSEFLIPMLILPLTMFALLAKGRRYKKMKKRLETCKDADVLSEYETDIDDLIMKKKVKVEHGMLLRNLFERIRDKMGEAKDKPSIPKRSGGSEGPNQGRGRPTPAPKGRNW